MIIGILAGLAGFILSARLNSSEAVAGVGYELNVIAAVVIGARRCSVGSARSSGR
jgi:inositol transport system permease protein